MECIWGGRGSEDDERRLTYNIGTGVVSLVAGTVVVLGPVLQLDGRVRTGSGCAGEGVDLVALVAGLDFSHVGDDLLGEFTLGCWVCRARQNS